MAGKFTNWLIWVLAVVCFGCVVWLFLDPIIWWTEKSEVTLYLRIFLLMFAVNTFAVLRLYNSIVMNTRFSIKLREALLKFQQSVPGLERSIKSLSTALGQVKSSSDSLKKSTDSNTEKVDKLSDKISKK